MPALSGVFGPNVWGANVWGANVWHSDGSGGGGPVEDSALGASISRYPTLSAFITRNPMGANEYKVGSTNTIRVKGPKNKDTREYLDGTATITLVAVYDNADVAVPGTEGIDIPYVSGIGRSAIYMGAVPHTVPLEDGAVYIERILIEDTDGNVLQEDTEIIAVS